MTSFSRVNPSRHSLSGFKWIIVSVILIGDGSVEFRRVPLSDRPFDFRKTLDYFVLFCIIRVCLIRRNRRIGDGHKIRSPSLSGGINSITDLGCRPRRAKKRKDNRVLSKRGGAGLKSKLVYKRRESKNASMDSILRDASFRPKETAQNRHERVTIINAAAIIAKDFVKPADETVFLLVRSKAKRVQRIIITIEKQNRSSNHFGWLDYRLQNHFFVAGINSLKSRWCGKHFRPRQFRHQPKSEIAIAIPASDIDVWSDAEILHKPKRHQNSKRQRNRDDQNRAEMSRNEINERYQNQFFNQSLAQSASCSLDKPVAVIKAHNLTSFGSPDFISSIFFLTASMTWACWHRNGRWPTPPTASLPFLSKEPVRKAFPAWPPIFLTYRRSAAVNRRRYFQRPQRIRPNRFRTTDHCPACSTTLPPTFVFDFFNRFDHRRKRQNWPNHLFGSTSTWYCWT